MKIPGSSSPIWFLPPFLVGVVLVVLMAAGREPPEERARVERARHLRVLELEPITIVPRVVGYGTAEAGQVWRAVAEIRGRVASVHPELRAGALLPKDTELLRLDAAEYELQVARLEASIEQANAQLAELEAQEENAQKSLEIERDSLELAQAALARSRNLLASGTVPQSQVDADERTVLAQRQQVQSLESQLNLIPAQRKSLGANVKVQEAQLAQARLDVERAVIVAPFDLRLGVVEIEVGQFVAAGQQLFEADGTAVSEVEAQLPIAEARKILPASSAEGLVPMGSLPEATMERMRQMFQVSAVVRLRGQGNVVQWDARFDRIREGLQVSTRTVGIVVAVDQPYGLADPGKRPPLVPGMFCEVELRGKPLDDRFVLPRTAIHEGHVYVLDAENRLQRVEVVVEFAQGELVALGEGLEAGARVVVSDPTPAVLGMLVEPSVDTELRDRLAAAARGEDGAE